MRQRRTEPSQQGRPSHCQGWKGAVCVYIPGQGKMGTVALALERIPTLFPRRHRILSSTAQLSTMNIHRRPGSEAGIKSSRGQR